MVQTGAILSGFALDARVRGAVLHSMYSQNRANITTENRVKQNECFKCAHISEKYLLLLNF